MLKPPAVPLQFTMMIANNIDYFQTKKLVQVTDAKAFAGTLVQSCDHSVLENWGWNEDNPVDSVAGIISK